MTQAIAAAVSVALAVKLKKIFEELFENQDKYLTFPKTAFGFEYSQLEFMKDPYKTSLSAQEQLQCKADFSRQMNFIPEDDPAFMPDASRFLWDEVKRILIDSIFAESGLTQDEERQLAEAIDFLCDFQVDSNGDKVRVNSSKRSKYYEYKILYEAAEETYLNEKLSVQFAEGPDAQKRKDEWNAYREGELLKARDKAMQDWINLGYKREVEEYQALLNSLEPRKYLLKYKQDYFDELKIFETPDLSMAYFSTTFFSPNDAFDQQLPWNSITLTKSEMVGLLGEAPPVLKDMYGADQGNVDIEAISLEYNNVIVIRPWFRSEFFGSRYWKLPDDRVISDGQVPRGGILPAFITSIIVARNVEIIRRKEVARLPVVLPLLSKVPVQTLKLSALSIAKTQRIARPPVAPIAGRPAVFCAKLAARAISKPATRSSFTRINPSSADIQPSATRAKEEVPPALKTKMFYTAAKYKGMTVQTPAGRSIIRSKPEGNLRLQPQNSQLVTEKINFDGVIVLALVCKRLPKSPDPDFSLQW